MDLQKFLIKLIKKRFQANAIIREIENQIKLIAEQKTFKKYKGKTLFRDNLEFELIGVKAQFWSFSTDIEPNKVSVKKLIN